MSVREIKPGLWEARAYLGVVRGEKEFKYKRVYGDKQDALAAERELKDRYGGKKKLRTYNLTTGEWFEVWLREYVAPYRAEGTLSNYVFTLKRILPYVESVPLRELAPNDLQRAYTQIGKRLSKASVRNTHRVIHVALKCAMKNDLIKDNPADRVELSPVPRFKPRVLTPKEAAKLLEAARGTQHYALLATALLTGMRLGELHRLTWADIDLAGGALQVKKSKTEAGERVVCLPSPIIPLLSEMYAARRPLPTDRVFIGKTGNPIYTSAMSKEYLRRITDKAGLPRMRFHDLRHTHITWLAAADISARTVADRVGHSDPSFTMRTYAHLSMDAQRQAAALAGDLLKLPETPKIK